MRGEIESLYPGITLRTRVINGWSHVCNYEEILRRSDSMRRLFCHAEMIVSSVLNYSYYIQLVVKGLEN